MLDFSTADQQRTFDLIPDGSIVPLILTIRPGGAGDGGWMKRSKAGDSMMLDCECVVLEGDYAKRKVWINMTVDGETDGQKTAVDITRSRIRAILESARGIDPADEKEAAIKARQCKDWGELDGICFWAVIGVEKGKDGYNDRNGIKAIVTPDRRDWKPIQQAGGARGAGMATPSQGAMAAGKGAPAGAVRPSWA